MPKMRGGERAIRTGISLHPKIMEALRGMTRRLRQHRRDEQDDVNQSRVLAALVWFSSGALEAGQADLAALHQSIAKELQSWRGKESGNRITQLIMAAYELTPYDSTEDEVPAPPLTRSARPMAKARKPVPNLKRPKIKTAA